MKDSTWKSQLVSSSYVRAIHMKMVTNLPLCPEKKKIKKFVKLKTTKWLRSENKNIVKLQPPRPQKEY